MPVPAPIPTDPLVAVIAGQDRQQIQLDRVREDVALLSDAARYQLAETLAHDSDLRQIVQLLGGVERPRRPVSARRRPSPPLPGDPR